MQCETAPLRYTPKLFTKNLKAQCMDAMDICRCEAFCCRHTNFKRMFQSASFRKLKKFSGDGAQPLPRFHPIGRGDSGRGPAPTPVDTYGTLIVASSAPPYQNPKYAIVCTDVTLTFSMHCCLAKVLRRYKMGTVDHH